MTVTVVTRLTIHSSILVTAVVFVIECVIVYSFSRMHSLLFNYAKISRVTVDMPCMSRSLAFKLCTWSI